MKKSRAIIWIGIALLIIFAAAWIWHLYDKPHQSAAGETAAFTVNADTLYHQYQADEHIADQKYLGKVITVTGRLSEIQHNGKSTIWILSPQPGGGGINCEIFAGTKTGPDPKPGDPITIKGRCTGFLMDVNLADCVPEK